MNMYWHFVVKPVLNVNFFFKIWADPSWRPWGALGGGARKALYQLRFEFFIFSARAISDTKYSNSACKSVF